MENSKLRRQIAYEAARLMYDRQESEYYRAKMKAARKLGLASGGRGHGWVKPADLPSNTEIRDQVQMLARLLEGEQRSADLVAMRLAALRLMRLLKPFRPRLIGSVLTGHTRRGSDIDLHLFSDSVEAVAHLLAGEGFRFTVEHKQVHKHGEQQTFRHIHIEEDWPFELTVYGERDAHYVFKSSITGKAIDRATERQLAQLIEREHPEIDIEEALAEAELGVDRFQLYEALLLPLENVKQNPRYHPEGDALFHSLQVFDHARDELPYDEEFLAAALLHDVGKAIDSGDHVAAGLEALGGSITERTAWLIEHHMLAHAIHDGSLGHRRHRRLRESPDYQELVLLGECDRAGRQPGAEAPELDEAIEYLRELRRMCG